MYIVNSIAELFNSQTQIIIDYFFKNPNTKLLDNQEDSIINFKKEILNDQTITLKVVSAKINISTTPISLTYVSNSSGLINTLVVLYDAYISYINVVLKEYPYLSLYNSNRHNDIYEFKNSDLYSKCRKKYIERKVVS